MTVCHQLSGLKSRHCLSDLTSPRLLSSFIYCWRFNPPFHYALRTAQIANVITFSSVFPENFHLKTWAILTTVVVKFRPGTTKWATSLDPRTRFEWFFKTIILYLWVNVNNLMYLRCRDRNFYGFSSNFVQKLLPAIFWISSLVKILLLNNIYIRFCVGGEVR